MFSINLYLGIALIIFFFVLYPLVIFLIFRNKGAILKWIAFVSFVMYVCVLACLVFGKISVKDNIFSVTILFNSTWFSLDFCVASFSLSNMFYNLIMMFPIAAFFLAISNLTDKSIEEYKKGQKKNFIKTVITSFLMSLLIELLQFVLPVSRTTEILDIVLNTLSGIIGYVFFFCAILICKKVHTKRYN